MEFLEYQKQANRTIADLGHEKLNLAHMVLGLGSEYNEYLQAIINQDLINIKEEIGDHFWYLANYCTLRNYNFDVKLAMSEDFENSSIFYTSKLQDLVKKYVAYNKEIDREIEYNLLQNIFTSLYNELTVLIDNVDIKEVLEQNINKLKVRFPDKFTEEKALNRDLEQEYKTLQ